MPWQGRAPPAGQELEAIIEPVSELFDAECGGARRRQLNRQRYSVKPPADCRTDRGKQPVKRKVRLSRLRPIEEQPNGAVSGSPSSPASSAGTANGCTG
jgi:hypothetical protein